MSKVLTNILAGIELDSLGRVVLADDALLQLEDIRGSLHAGGISNGGCTNFTICNGELNSNCSNSICDGSQNMACSNSSSCGGETMNFTKCKSPRELNSVACDGL